MAKEIIELEVKSNISQASKDTDKLADNLKDVNKEAKESLGNFSVMGVSLNSLKAGFKGAMGSAKLMFGSIRAGLISTGIGALLVAFGSLVTYFTKTKRGADQLSKGMAGVSAAVSVITDRLSKLGGSIVKLFSGDIKGAINDVKGAFSGMGAEIRKESKAMIDLEDRTHKLRDAENEFAIQKAATRQEIEKARLIAEDETKTAKERLDNLKVALELEEKTTNRELELAKEKVAIQQEQMALSENLAEDEEKLSQLKVDLISKETASVKMRKRVITEVNSLEREIHSEQKSILDEKKAADKEREGVLTKMPRMTSSINNEIIKSDNKVLENYIKNTKARKKLTEEQFKAQLNASVQFAGAVQNLAGESKALSTAQALINTYLGVTEVMKDKTIPSTTAKFLMAGAVLTNGLANVKKIMSTDVGSGGGGSVATPSSGTPAPEMLSSKFELGGGAEVEPVQAFVVTDDMTNSQNKLANIRRRATI